MSRELINTVPRVGVGLVYLLWGIDKFLYPDKYHGWISVSWKMRLVIDPFMDIYSFIFLLGLFETLLGLILILGILIKFSSLLVILSSILFLLFAGPPMSYPQDIALIAVGIWMYYNGYDSLSIDKRLFRA